MNDQLLTPKQVREMLNLSNNTVRALADKGDLPCIWIKLRSKGQGHRRWKLSDVEAYMQKGSK